MWWIILGLLLIFILQDILRAVFLRSKWAITTWIILGLLLWKFKRDPEKFLLDALKEIEH